MNKKLGLISLAIFALASCAKTKDLFKENQYNSPIFDENYYTEWSNIKSLKIRNVYNQPFSSLMFEGTETNTVTLKHEGNNYNPNNLKWDDEKAKQFGYNNNLSKTEKKFAYGVTSKLFDGRVRCERKYQLSRVQLDKSGFAMYFPKSLVSAKYLGFGIRGGTDFPEESRFEYKDLKVNFKWTFYIHVNETEYDKVIYNIHDAVVPVDNGGNTNFIHFMPFGNTSFDELNGAVAMSFEWECNDSRLSTRNVTDDYTDKEKHHLSMMLYEVFIGQSVWH